MKAVLRIAVVMGVLAVAAAAGAETRYHIVHLGAGEALAVNNSGQIVGYTPYSGIRAPCIFYANGDEPLLLGGIHPDYGWGHALDISDAGQIVGWAYDEPFPDNDQRAVLFDATGGGANIDLGTLGGAHSTAYAINSAGIIVGKAQGTQPPYFTSHATLFDATGGGANVALSSGTYVSSSAYGINDSGLIVGDYAPSAQSYGEGALWDTSGNRTDLGPYGSGWYNSDAVDINEANEIVGGSSHNDLGAFYPIHWDGPASSPWSVIGPVEHRANAINDLGVAVGASWWAGSPLDAKKFVSDGGGWISTDLQTRCQPGHWMDLTYASDINNDGWIVGSAAGPNAFLLKPITPGDLDYDCDVDFDDLNLLLAGYDNSADRRLDLRRWRHRRRRRRGLRRSEPAAGGVRGRLSVERSGGPRVERTAKVVEK